MMACHKGFGINTGNVGPNPAELINFLELKSATFSCDKLSTGIVVTDKVAVKAWYYLLASVGALWQITGVSWAAVNLLIATLFAFSVGFSYLIFRLVMNRYLAFAGSLIFAFIYYHLVFTARLRDYAKAPFLLACIWILAYLVVNPLRYRSQVLFALLLGAIAGIGYGFRPDILIVLPFAVMTFLFFLPGGCWNYLWRNLGLVIAVVVSFCCLATPVLSTFSDTRIGTCNWHFAQLGLSAPITAHLGLNSLFYDWGSQFNDSLAAPGIFSYAKRMLDLENIAYCSRVYDVVSFQQYWHIVSAFPADILTRGLASIATILNAGHVLWLTAAFVLVLAWNNLRLALFTCLFIGYFLGYPAIQFAARHYFYLLIFCWIPVGFFLGQGLYRVVLREGWMQTLASWQAIKTSPATLKAPLRRLILLILILLLIAIAISGARWYQQQQIAVLIKAYLSAPAKPISSRIDFTEKGPFIAFTELANFGKEQSPGQTKMLRISFDKKHCQGVGPVTLLYASIDQVHDFSQMFSLMLPQSDEGTIELFVPVYFYTDFYQPTGIEISRPSCVTQIAEITQPNFYPLWMTIQIPSDWKQRLPEYRQTFQ